MALTSYWLMVIWIMAMMNLWIACERSKRQAAHYAEYLKQLKKLEDEELVHMEQDTKFA
jgi:hypothetical protein